jgi:acetyl esterase/lipase
LRAATEGLAAFAAPPPPVKRRDETLAAGRLAVRVYAPPDGGDAPGPALLYFHGGGWISGGLESHDAICATLAAHGGCRVIAVDYRLAPERRFPAALEDGAAALRAIAADPRRFGVDPNRLGIAGDSAGANLAVVLARETPTPLALQLLLCPVIAPLGLTNSRAALASGWLIEEATMARYWDFYRVAGLAPDDSRVAPLCAGDFASLPPAIVHVAEFDPLRDEGELYAGALTAAGVRAEVVVHAGLIHHFYGLGGVIPAARPAFERVCDGLRRSWDAIG